MKSSTSPIDLLRKQSSMYLSHLPDAVRIPALPPSRPDDVIRPLMEATIDDVAFAIQGLEADSSAINRRLAALRDLHDGARQRGATGDITVSEAFPDILGEGARK